MVLSCWGWREDVLNCVDLETELVMTELGENMVEIGSVNDRLTTILLDFKEDVLMC